MWRVTEANRHILGDVFVASQGDEGSSEDLMQREIKLKGKKQSFTIKELISRDRLSCDEVDAMQKSLPKEVEFHKFVDSLQPHFISVLPSSEDRNTFAPPMDPTKAKEAYRQRIERLRREQENREYQAMTQSIDPSQRYGRANLMENFGKDMRDVNRQVMAIVNTLITVGGAFVFGFFGLQLAYPSLQLDIATRMLVGLVLGTIVFFADLYFIIKTMDGPETSSTNSSTKPTEYTLDLRSQTKGNEKSGMPNEKKEKRAMKKKGKPVKESKKDR